MSQTRPDDTPLPLAFDDPRISEWIDGRLSGHEAEEVARAVAASAELGRFVAELRALKEAAAGIPAAVAPRDFVQRVMAAVGTSALDGGEDAAVEAEWRKLEAERIEEERDEARDDAIEAPAPAPRRWPWVALAASLAAGVLVAAFLNLSLDRRREVAMEAPSAELLADARPAAVVPPPEQPAEKAVSAEAPRPMTAAAARSKAAAPPRTMAAREVALRVDGPRGRRALGRLLAEAGISGRDGDNDPAAGKRAGAAVATMADDRLELVASPAAIDAFVAAVERAADEGLAIVEPGIAEDRKAGDAETGQNLNLQTLVIHVVETAEPTQPAADRQPAKEAE
ncbi:MAG: hypothetical protein ACKOC8_00380 [Pirellulales bacterium]